MSDELTNYEDCMNELNKLRGIILSLNNNCRYQGKDRDGAVLYSFEPGFDAQLSFSWANSHIKAIENFFKAAYGTAKARRNRSITQLA